MATNTILPGVVLPNTGIPLVDAGFSIISQQLSRAATDIQTALNSSGGGGGGTGGGSGTAPVPTNAPVPTGITVIVNSDGSMDVTLTWNYTQGTVQADFMVLVWAQGNSPLGTPSSVDKAILLAATARSFTFQGWNPNSNYRFGIAAGRKDDATTSIGIGSVVAPTSSPDWADISASGDYTANVAGTVASTVVSNAMNGATAYAGTTNYRSTGAPSNVPVPSSLTTGVDSDGSARYIMSWSYTQGTLKADGFIFFVKEGDTGTFALTDPHFELGAQNAGTFSAAITLKGYPSDRAVSFGVAAFRRTENALEIGSIVTSASAPDWQGVTTGTPNYAGTIFGIEQHNFAVAAAGRSATNPISSLTRDGQALVWAGRDAEFLGGPRAALGLSYNLTVYDLIAKTAIYQHCFDLADFGSASANADFLNFTTSGGGSILQSTAGKFGNCVAFNAQGGQVANLTTLAASTQYTGLKWIETWFSHTGDVAAATTLLCLTDNGFGTGSFTVSPLQFIPGGTVRAAAWNGSSTITVTSSATVNDGNFHHIAAAIQSGALRLWIDGVLQGSAGSGLTSFSMSPPGGGVYLTLNGVGSVSQLFETNGTNRTKYDELILSDNGTFRANNANFTVPSQEVSDYADGSTILLAWHFQELTGTGYFFARRAPRSLANLLVAYAAYQKANAGVRLLFILQGCYDPSANRLVDGLPDILEASGGRRALFSANSFQAGSAYILIGEPQKGAGNGLEAYAGAIADDTTAQARIAFQTQGSQVVGGAGAGWDPIDTPGVPTNQPAPSSVSVTSGATGTDTITVSWTYTQPTLSGSNRLADGFVVYVTNGDTGSPAASPTASYKVAVDGRSFTMQSPYQQTWSFAVAAYRNTANGMEIGTPVTSAGGPDWQGVGGGSQVQTSGIADVNVTTPKIASGAITTSKRQPVNVLTASYTVGALGLTGVVFSHGLGSTPMVTTSTGDSNIIASPFFVDSSQIQISLYNTTQPPSSPRSGTLTVFFW